MSGGLGGYRHGVAEDKGVEWHVQRVASHVTQGSGAEVPKATPLEGMVGFVIGTRGSWAKPFVPMDVVRDTANFGRSASSLRPDRTVCPNMNFLDVAQDTRLNHGRRLAETVQSGSLVTHHRGNASFTSEVTHGTCFVNRMGKRLLAEAVLVHTHRHDGCNRMVMIRRTHGDRIDFVTHLFEHATEVVVCLRFAETQACPLQGIIVDVAYRDDLTVSAGIGRIASALSTNADTRKLNLLIGRSALCLRDSTSGPITNAGGGGAFQKGSAMWFHRHV